MCTLCIYAILAFLVPVIAKLTFLRNKLSVLEMLAWSAASMFIFFVAVLVSLLNAKDM